MKGGFCVSRARGPYLTPFVCETEIVLNSPPQPLLSIPEIERTKWQKNGEAHSLAVSGIWMDGMKPSIIYQWLKIQYILMHIQRIGRIEGNADMTCRSHEPRES